MGWGVVLPEVISFKLVRCDSIPVSARAAGRGIVCTKNRKQRLVLLSLRLASSSRCTVSLLSDALIFEGDMVRLVRWQHTSRDIPFNQSQRVTATSGIRR
jgi:hypothetical protein